ncbi:MAG: HIT family protein [Bacilli bacterium]|nr:HIT family protein [Bacilli bacterium]
MCVFCKIANGEIPSYRVYEDQDFLAFLDLSQATIGHTLVIPKKHYDNIFDLNHEEAGKLMQVAVKVSQKLQSSLQIKSLNLLNNSGALAGQTVNHFHVHLIPRYENDNLIMKFPQNQLSKEEFEDLLNKVNH